MVQMLSPSLWAVREFGGADLGDERINQRLVKVAAAAAASPSRSIPGQCRGAWRKTKGAYRLFDNSKVSFDKLQEPHRQLTLEAAGKCSTVLWVSDTSTLSFAHPHTTGLGPTSTGGSGMLLHSTLGIDVSMGIDVGMGIDAGSGEGKPRVLGLGHQQVWSRPKGKKKAAKVPESRKWKAGIDAIGTPPPGVRWVQVGDAESDCWEAIEACRDAGSGFAIRACQNRLVHGGHGSQAQATGSQARATEPVLLFDLLEKQPMLGGKHLYLRSRPDRPARWAKLAISAMAVTVLAPKNWSDKPHRKGRPRPEPIQCWAVRVWELEPPEGQEPAEWVILTDECVEDLESAVKVAFWYTCRWLIEEYHKCLKTGCRIESRQLEEAKRLERLLGVLAVVAVRLLQLKHQAKINPDAPAQSVVPEPYVKTMKAYLKLPPKKKLTAYQFWRETARMGGFLARKGDGEPGWITLWHGWEELELLTAGFELAEKMRGRCG
jgi:hypothetical protein